MEKEIDDPLSIKMPPPLFCMTEDDVRRIKLEIQCIHNIS
ncbi:hypothetical protein IC006_1240 [Sulfuracidifex tepidarius]|uniref:Uncharacterized protein n=1 Tax=Sulfuracidifex tepidarius TaxID=1294262 RepID=A0A510DUP5_9CREN|nr:hypothetical protein IC006_1240 [Sulfuracidifex tepidarius]BBG26697.1 hypothetical protein IC007_1215 [Sulfuracidifex tepidarius]